MKYVAAIYARISVEEAKNSSIDNQIKFLSDYADKENIKIYDYYIDSGYTGTNFNRPAFNNLLSDINNHKFNTIIIKDLSRLGRNYLEVTYYLEKYLPIHNIRLIAINDNLDTLNDYDNHFIAIKNIMNSYYAYDISKKIKFTINKQMKDIKNITTYTPLYGYKYNKEKKRVIIPELKEIITLIYSYYINGHKISSITKYLNENNIKSPSSYYHNKNNKWNYQTVKNILTNYEYMGFYSRHKTEYNMKIKKSNKIDNNLHYKLYNKELTIIDEATFNKVRLLMENHHE